MNEIVDLVSQVGFPIAAYILSALAVKYMYDKSNEQTTSAYEKIGDLTEAVNNNTTVLTHLVEKVEKEN